MKFIGATDTVGGYIGAEPPQQSGSAYGVAKLSQMIAKAPLRTQGAWAFYNNNTFYAQSSYATFPGTSYNYTAYVRRKNLQGPFELEVTMGSTGNNFSIGGSNTAMEKVWGFGCMVGETNVGTNFRAGKQSDGNYVFLNNRGIGDTSSSFSYGYGYQTSSGLQEGTHTFSHAALTGGEVFKIKRTDTEWVVSITKDNVETVIGTCPHIWKDDCRLVLAVGNFGGQANPRYSQIKYHGQNTQAQTHEADILNYHDHCQMEPQRTNNSGQSYENTRANLNFSSTNGYGFYQTDRVKGDFSTTVKFVSWNTSGGDIATTPDGSWGVQLGCISAPSKNDRVGSMSNGFIYQQSKLRFWIGLRGRGNNTKVGLFISDSQGNATELASVNRFIPSEPIFTIVRRNGVFKCYYGSEYENDLIFDDVRGQISGGFDTTLSRWEGPWICGCGINANSGTAMYKDFQITTTPRIVGEQSVAPKGVFSIREAYNKATIDLWIPGGSGASSSFALGSGGTAATTTATFEGWNYALWQGAINNQGYGDGYTLMYCDVGTAGVVDWLLIGGGGGGGYTDQGYQGGGGGAGQVIWARNFTLPAGTISMRIGNGAGRSYNPSQNHGFHGGYSRIWWGTNTPNTDYFQAEGGGAGSGYNNAYVIGTDGGSGGGSENGGSSCADGLSGNDHYNNASSGAVWASWGTDGGGSNGITRSGGGGGAFAEGGHGRNADSGSYQYNTSEMIKFVRHDIGYNGGTGLFLPEWGQALNIGRHGYIASGGNGANYTAATEHGGIQMNRHGGGMAGGNNGESGTDGYSVGDGGGGSGDWRYNNSNKRGGSGGPGAFIVRWRA